MRWLTVEQGLVLDLLRRPGIVVREEVWGRDWEDRRRKSWHVYDWDTGRFIRRNGVPERERL